jgi:predicted MPP superfamily phosphohydrolase
MRSDLLLSLVSQAIYTAAARLLFAALLLFVQYYFIRAVLRTVKSLEIEKRKERYLISTVTIIFALANIPLAWFIIESLFTPGQVMLYSPAPEQEWIARPLSYLFFVWNLGSLIFAAASPIAMACFAAFQFLRRKRRRRIIDAVEDDSIEAVDLSRRRFLKMALSAAAAMPFAASFYGAVAARFGKMVERVTVPVRDLPPQLDGLTIIQMSDIHVGLFMSESRVREFVEIANNLSPDIVALTGDFLASRREQVAPFMNAISGLEAKYGVFGCLGNHDEYAHSERLLAKEFDRAGFKMLRNENRLIDVAGAKLNIIGVDFIGKSGNGEKLKTALDGIPLEGTTLLLCHSPYPFDQAARMGIDLMLSGHTHGGQIVLALGDYLLTPARLATVFLSGLFRIDGSHLYVNRGLGTTGPPIRIGAPPEITHITLKAA